MKSEIEPEAEVEAEGENEDEHMEAEVAEKVSVHLASKMRLKLCAIWPQRRFFYTVQGGFRL